LFDLGEATEVPADLDESAVGEKIRADLEVKAVARKICAAGSHGYVLFRAVQLRRSCGAGQWHRRPTKERLQCRSMQLLNRTS